MSIVLIISLYGTLDAMNWPSEDANVVRNFGWNDRGKPVLGVVFTGDTEILAAENGEVIFTRRKNDTASRLPSPLGAWTALDHGDGLISIYSRCADEGRPFGQVEKQQPIAESGISGWSGQKGFYFFLYDRRERRWINPAMIITPLKDTRPPQILSVDLVNAEGVNTQMRNLGQGRYTILVTAAGANLLAPQRIICSINGAEVGALNFETISARDGVLMVYRNGLVPAKQIYTNFPAYEAADVFLNRGQVSMEIIVQDIAGNSRSSVSRMTVN
ncbi:MAG: M23 family metallopeptidase [Treponema sp.]|nr:M23 family metallopeptidase [Treponema sp.]